jgi:hypothetical protein
MLARCSVCRLRPAKSHPSSSAACFSALRTPEFHIGRFPSCCCGNTHPSPLPSSSLAIHCRYRSRRFPSASVRRLRAVLGSSMSPRQCRCSMRTQPNLQVHMLDAQPGHLRDPCSGFQAGLADQQDRIPQERQLRGSRTRCMGLAKLSGSISLSWALVKIPVIRLRRSNTGLARNSWTNVPRQRGKIWFCRCRRYFGADRGRHQCPAAGLALHKIAAPDRGQLAEAQLGAQCRAVGDTRRYS